MKVYLGNHQDKPAGWITVSADPTADADVRLDADEFVRLYAGEVEEIFVGDPATGRDGDEAVRLLGLLDERLGTGASIVAAGSDGTRLLDLFGEAGLTAVALEGAPSWAPQQSSGAWVRAVATGTVATRAAVTAEASLPSQVLTAGDGTGTAGVAARVTEQEILLRQLTDLRAALSAEAERRTEIERGFEDAARQLDDARDEIAALRATGVVLTSDEDVVDPASDRPAVLPGNAPIVPPPPAPSPDEVPTTLKGRVRRAVAARLPEGSERRRKAKIALDGYRETVDYGRRLRRLWQTRSIQGALQAAGMPRMTYDSWLAGHVVEPGQVEAQRVWAVDVARHATPTSIQVIVLAGTGSVGATLASLSAQSWQTWSAAVCLPQGGAAAPGDHRIRYVDPGHLSEAAVADAQVAAADADFVVVMRAGDTLEPDCLFTVASAFHRDPLLKLVVWDDDVRSAAGARSAPRFRPSWSPEMLLGADYIGTACAIKRTGWLQAGGLDERFGPSALWNLLLGLGGTDETVFRSSRVLSSVAQRRGPDPATAAAVVQHHLDARGLAATAELVDQVVRVNWTLPQAPSVTVVIPTRHNRAMLSTCLPSLMRTEYPGRFDVVIVDNGGWSADNERWYAEHKGDLDLQLIWWTQTPFNYSAVNNAGAAKGKGDVLVFLNDDTELLSPSWMTELVGWATQPEIGVAGLQLIGPDDEIQHTGVILGLGGFADHIFEGTRPHEDSIFGRNDWYRNSLAVTGACMAMRREFFDAIGGMDERFILCGSDVAIGLDSVLRGYRNVCSPFGTVRHLESATRGTNVPHWDFFMSYWRYSSWLFGGDPYFSPNVSLSSRVPTFRSAAEPTPQERVSLPLGRSFQVFRQSTTESESVMLADMCLALPIDEVAVDRLHADNAEPFEVRTINWFIPDIDSPFYGGINTALRIADELARVHGVQNRFVVWGAPNENFVRSALASAFPALQHSEIVFYSRPTAAALQSIPYADASIATLWVTAYAVAHVPNTRRKFYLIQDFEPMFYPASTLYALAEESYRLGLYGLCNTDNLRKIYADEYAGKGMSFSPAVDPSVFHARTRVERAPDEPVTIFVYGRPGHWRNCWEMAALALEEVKRRLGDRVRIVTAGAWAEGGGAQMDIKRLGLLDYRATGELYRHCDVGLALTVSKHPSYLPLELMACGAPVVTFDNPWGHWILQDGVNSLQAKRTVDSLVDRLEKLCVDAELRRRLQGNALDRIAKYHGDWSTAIAPIYPYLCDPEGRQQ